MPRIDLPLASHMADHTRPVQQGRDLQLQAEAARTRALSPDTYGEELVSPETTGSDDLRAAAEELKQVVEVASGRTLRFDIDSESKEFLVKVMDEETGELVTQIPSKEMLSLRRRLDELVGVLVDKSA